MNFVYPTSNGEGLAVNEHVSVALAFVVPPSVGGPEFPIWPERISGRDELIAVFVTDDDEEVIGITDHLRN